MSCWRKHCPESQASSCTREKPELGTEPGSHPRPSRSLKKTCDNLLESRCWAHPSGRSNTSQRRWKNASRKKSVKLHHRMSILRLHIALVHKLTRHTTGTRGRETQGRGSETDRRRYQATNGRRCATRGKNASSVTWYSGTPAPGDPMPPHWVHTTSHW